MTSVVISLAWELERGAGGSRGGAGAKAATAVPDAGVAAGSAMVAGAGALPGADALADAADADHAHARMAQRVEPGLAVQAGDAAEAARILVCGFRHGVCS